MVKNCSGSYERSKGKLNWSCILHDATEEEERENEEEKQKKYTKQQYKILRQKTRSINRKRSTASTQLWQYSLLIRHVMKLIEYVTKNVINYSSFIRRLSGVASDIKNPCTAS